MGRLLLWLTLATTGDDCYHDNDDIHDDTDDDYDNDDAVLY